MIKTVWIKNNIISSLQTKDNILYYTHKSLMDYLSAIEDYIILYEPDGSLGVLIHCNAATSITEFKETSIPQICSLSDLRCVKNQVLNAPEGCLIPLRADGTEVYGAVLIPEASSITISDNGWEIVRDFANYLYSEAMGGIVKSLFPEMVRVRNLEVAYRNSGQIIKGIDFDICENELTVIQGSSGCGKTTTANVIGGMLKPNGGTVMWNGKDIATMNQKELTEYRRKIVGFIFQHFNLISDLSAKENINIAASLVDNPMPVEEALSMVGLSDKVAQYPGKLSGGEQQRICIARAIAKRPKLLICDEPTGSLDPENAIRLMKILQNLVKEQHIAVVMITHNPAFGSLADHNIVISTGKIIEDSHQPFPMYAENLKLR